MDSDIYNLVELMSSVICLQDTMISRNDPIQTFLILTVQNISNVSADSNRCSESKGGAGKYGGNLAPF